MAERRTSFCDVRVGVADSFLMSYTAVCQWKFNQVLARPEVGSDRGNVLENSRKNGQSRNCFSSVTVTHSLMLLAAKGPVFVTQAGQRVGEVGPRTAGGHGKGKGRHGDRERNNFDSPS